MNRIASRHVIFGLLGVTLLLLILNIWSYLNFYYGDLHTESYFYRKFNFDREKNFPSIFSSLLHFSAAFSLALVSFTRLEIRNRKFFWRSLAFLFLFLGLDELLRIHEKVGASLSDSVETSGIFQHAWIIPYGIALVVLAILYFKPVSELPKKTLYRFILSGAVFIAGAVGLEMVAGSVITQQGLEGTDVNPLPNFFVLYTIEELLEKLGISFFIYSILKFRDRYRIS